MAVVVRSLSLFVLAGLCEIGGGYLVWGRLIAQEVPDAFDLLGGAICLIGVSIIMYWPRG